MATANETDVKEADELECGCVCLRGMDRNSSVEPAEGGYQPSPKSTPSHSPAAPSSPRLANLRKRIMPRSPRNRRRVEPEGSGSPGSAKRYVSVETAERSGSPRLMLRYVKGHPPPEITDKVNTPNATIRPLASKAVSSEPILRRGPYSFDSPLSSIRRSHIPIKTSVDNPTPSTSTQLTASPSKCFDPVTRGSKSDNDSLYNVSHLFATESIDSGSTKDEFVLVTAEPKDAEVASIHTTSSPRVTFQLGDMDDQDSEEFVALKASRQNSNVSDSSLPDDQQQSAESATPPTHGDDEALQTQDAAGSVSMEEETVVTSVVPEKHVATMLASNTCTLLLTMDHLLVTGSFRKESRGKLEAPDQYGQSLTDRDLLEVPQPPDSRNARTAPSTPEVETRGLSRNAESTSHLEMASVRQRQTTGGATTNGSRCSEPASGQKTPQKEPSPKLNKSRNEKFHKLFKCVPDNEVVLKSYSCAYFGDILLQGFLYISPNWFCFYSKILGHEKQIEIPVEKVFNLTREKTAFIIPNAIGIVTPQDKYVFGSLMSRDSTYRLMWNVWKQVKAGDIGDKPDLDSDANTENENGISGSDNNNILMKPRIELQSASFDSEESSQDSMCLECGLPVSAHEGKEDACRCTPAPTPDSMLISEERSLTTETTPPSPGSSSPADTSVSSGRSSHRKAFLSIGSGYSAVKHAVGRLVSLSRNNLLLALCTFLVVLLSISAVIMTYKIVLLQARLDNSLGWVDPHTSKYLHSYKLYSDLYVLNHQFHTSTIERFHSVLEANIQLLGQVHQSLKSLQDSPLVADKCNSASVNLSNES